MQLKRIGRKFTTLLRRFHIVLFVVLVLGGLAIAVFMLSTTLQNSADPTGSDAAAGLNTNFDTETIDRISELRTGSDSPNDIQLPSGRINPFAE